METPIAKIGEADRVEHPGVPAREHHPAEHHDLRERDQQDREHLEEVRERRRVLERDGRVRVVVAAAVRPQLLDRDHRRHGAARDRLVRALERRRGDVPVEGLRHSLPDQDHREDDRERQQDVDDRAVEVAPEVAEADTSAAAGDAANDRCDDSQSDAGGDELLHRQPRHLAEVRHRRLAGVVLPVRVRDEARRRVERHRPGHGRQVIGIEEQMPLQPQQPVEEDAESNREDDHRPPVLLPVLVGGRVAPEQAEEAALDHVALFAGVDARHPDAQRVAECDEDGRVDEDLCCALSHQRRSPRTSA